MHIQQVQIKNFRCFEDLTFNLNPDVNIFVGNNGSGKSAVLDAITAAIYPYLYEFQLVLDVNTSEKDNLKTLNLFQRDIRNGKKTDESENIVQFSIETIEAPKLTTTYFKKTTDNYNLNSPLHQEISSEIHDYIYRHGEHLTNYWDFPIFAYYRSHRNFLEKLDAQDNFNQDFDPFDALKNSFDATASFTDLANWFFIRRFHELSEVQKRGDLKFELSDLKQIRKAISTIIAPNANVYFTQNTSAKLMVEWETETGEKIELSLNQLSSGYRNMLALVMDFARRLAQANPQMENPLEAEAVLMIDELDLHLHPTWQQKIIPDLRKVFPNTQIIATTHSPEIVTTVERHQVKILENYQIKECPTPTRGRSSSDIVRDVLGLEKLRPDTEESRTLTALFDAIDKDNLEEAKRLRLKLQDWEHFDSDLIRADMQIHRLQRKVKA